MTREPIGQAANWLAGRLLRPVLTTAEAQILTGQPTVGDDTIPAVSAVDAGLVTLAQVDALRHSWKHARCPPEGYHCRQTT